MNDLCPLVVCFSCQQNLYHFYQTTIINKENKLDSIHFIAYKTLQPVLLVHALLMKTVVVTVYYMYSTISTHMNDIIFISFYKWR